MCDPADDRESKERGGVDEKNLVKQLVKYEAEAWRIKRRKSEQDP